MIKLSEISTENTEKFLEDTHRRMYDMLSDSERDANYGRIIYYCSTEGHLDNGKIRRLLTGNISDLRDAIVNIGPIENVAVKGNSKIYIITSAIEPLVRIGRKCLGSQSALIVIEAMCLL